MTPTDDVATAVADAADDGPLPCAACGDPAGTAYVPVRGGEPDRQAAVCQRCGYNDVGYAGCAPEAGDLDAEALVRIDPDGSATVTDERD